MGEIKIADATLELYRTLLLKRDALRKEGEHLQIDYIRTFGELLEERYSLFIECIKYKKILSFCLARKNNGLPIYRAELDSYVESTMDVYYAELQALSETRKAERHTLSEIEVFRIKKLYRKLAMMLHPDLHPAFRGDFDAYDLWHKIKRAYECNDYEALKETEVLAAALLAKKEGAERKIEVPNVEEKITSLRLELAQIVREDPYLYKFLLQDEEAVENKRAELKKDIEDYKNYLEELKEEAESYRIEEDV